MTIELIGQIERDEYIAFGLSGSDNSSRMIGADLALNYLEHHLGYTKDYNITGAFPVTLVVDILLTLFLINLFTLSVHQHSRLLQGRVPGHQSRWRGQLSSESIRTRKLADAHHLST